MANVDRMIYAICDRKDGNNAHKCVRYRSNDTSSSESDNDEQRSSEYRILQSFATEDSILYLNNIDVRQLSMFPNKNKWWHKGGVTYGYHLYKMTEETISKLFKSRSEPIENKLCPICLDDLIFDLVTLNGCLHAYHRPCFLEYAIKVNKPKVLCPLCYSISVTGSGPSPPGRMSWSLRKDLFLLINDSIVNSIEIKYKLKGGKQLVFHPHPGKPYKGVVKKAYLPVSSDFILVLRMLILAFMDGQTFKIETNQDNDDIIVWNGIEHKTSPSGGITNNGFPDKNYKRRVINDLNSKGILHNVFA